MLIINHGNDHDDENKCSAAKAWCYNLKIHEKREGKKVMKGYPMSFLD
jgi:hypothetical protein